MIQVDAPGTTQGGVSRHDPRRVRAFPTPQRRRNGIEITEISKKGPFGQPVTLNQTGCLADNLYGAPAFAEHRTNLPLSGGIQRMNRNIAAASNPGNRRLILAAVALGLLGALLVYMASSSKGGSSPSSAPAGEGVPVVIAKADIPARTKITAPMVEVRLVPLDAASALGFKDASQVVGQVTRFPIAVNEQVLTNKIVSLAGTAAAGRSLSYVVPPGKRAVAISSNDVES